MIENMVKTVQGRKKPMIPQDDEKVAVLTEIRSENTDKWGMNYKTEEEKAISLSQTKFLYYKEKTFPLRKDLVEKLDIDIKFANHAVISVKSEIKTTKDPTKLEDLRRALVIWEAHLQKLQNWLSRLPLTAGTDVSIWHAISKLADVVDHHLTSSRTSSP